MEKLLHLSWGSAPWSISVGQLQDSNECVVMLTEWRQVLRTGSAVHRSHVVTLEAEVLSGHSQGVLEAALESSMNLEHGGDSTYNPAGRGGR